jgi:hypothetical protein
VPGLDRHGHAVGEPAQARGRGDTLTTRAPPLAFVLTLAQKRFAMWASRSIPSPGIRALPRSLARNLPSGLVGVGFDSMILVTIRPRSGPSSIRKVRRTARPCSGLRKKLQLRSEAARMPDRRLWETKIEDMLIPFDWVRHGRIRGTLARPGRGVRVGLA